MNHWKVWKEGNMASENLEMFLLAKGTALQQAGKIPVNHDLDQIAEAVERLLQVEGLH